MMPPSVHQLLVTTGLLVLTSLPRVASRSLLSSLSSLDQYTGTSTNELSPSFSKRQGADVWSLCPETMPMRQCFDRYLSIYARLRNEASSRESITIRNIGKRASLERPSYIPASSSASNQLPDLQPSLQFRDLCPSTFSKVRCASYIADLVLGYVNSQSSQDNDQSGAQSL